jgi:hypothetical protein
MTKNLSIILTAGACAGLITAAGLSQTSAQENMGQKPGMEQNQGKGEMQPGMKRSTTMERSSNTAAGNIRMVTIMVKDVDRSSNTVTFQAKVSPEANIKKNGTPIAIDQLNPGDSLQVSFDPRTGEVVRAEVVKKAPQ